MGAKFSKSSKRKEASVVTEEKLKQVETLSPNKTSTLPSSATLNSTALEKAIEATDIILEPSVVHETQSSLKSDKEEPSSVEDCHGTTTADEAEQINNVQDYQKSESSVEKPTNDKEEIATNGSFAHSHTTDSIKEVNEASDDEVAEIIQEIPQEEEGFENTDNKAVTIKQNNGSELINIAVEKNEESDKSVSVESEQIIGNGAEEIEHVISFIGQVIKGDPCKDEVGDILGETKKREELASAEVEKPTIKEEDMETANDTSQPEDAQIEAENLSETTKRLEIQTQMVNKEDFNEITKERVHIVDMALTQGDLVGVDERQSLIASETADPEKIAYKDDEAQAVLVLKVDEKEEATAATDEEVPENLVKQSSEISKIDNSISQVVEKVQTEKECLVIHSSGEANENRTESDPDLINHGKEMALTEKNEQNTKYEVDIPDSDEPEKKISMQVDSIQIITFNSGTEDMLSPEAVQHACTEVEKEEKLESVIHTAGEVNETRTVCNLDSLNNEKETDQAENIEQSTTYEVEALNSNELDKNPIEVDSIHITRDESEAEDKMTQEAEQNLCTDVENDENKGKLHLVGEKDKTCEHIMNLITNDLIDQTFDAIQSLKNSNLSDFQENNGTINAVNDIEIINSASQENEGTGVESTFASKSEKNIFDDSTLRATSPDEGIVCI